MGNSRRQGQTIRVKATPFLVSAVFLLFLAYPWDKFVRLFQNFSIVDLFWAGILLVCLSNPTTASRLIRLLLASVYGGAVWTLLLLLTVSTLFSTDPMESLKVLVQFAFVFLVTIPLMVVAIQLSTNPLQPIAAICNGYLFLYLIGLGLNLEGGIDILVANTGIGRYFPAWELGFHLITMAGAIALAKLVFGYEHVLLNIVIFAGSVVALVFAGSRAGLLGLALSYGVGMLVGRKRIGGIVRKIRLLLIGAGAAVLFWAGPWYAALGIYDRRFSFFFDYQRPTSYWYPVLESLDSLPRLLFGTGLGNYRWLDDVIHDVFIQIFVESGVLAFLLFALLIGLPLILLSATVRPRVKELQVCAILYSALIPFFLFHPLATLRVYWLPFASVLGLSYWVRADHPGTDNLGPTLLHPPDLVAISWFGDQDIPRSRHLPPGEGQP